ncbi:acetate/propionate family kinase [Novosphingobium profundi]|uniref:acetate/propionate family kinase n=1 Tax=Novosphingobium profundi TaxID=1774954 RepID=UPI001BDAFA56|nr:acetate/propionate family kinase [Novosphingobium profundi]MBT0671521.1 acetate/propionate family kinase [Novosphingobium profundi]
MKAIVALNSGSSSIKFGVYRLDQDHLPVHSAGGKIEKIGIAPAMRIATDDGEVLLERAWPDGAAMTHSDLLDILFDWARDHVEDHAIVAIGHRVVHGGTRLVAPERVTPALLDELEALSPLAPLHQPHNLVAIRSLARLAPDLPQVACFDTAFHHDKPALASRMAIPRALHESGIRRYGFHGLSYEYVASQLRQIDPEMAQGRLIAAHLGNGASLCAMKDGRSIDTTMGFTALDGLMMGTRCGRLDPGAVLHLQTQLRYSAQQVETMLYTQSGLLGVSGISSDMRELESSPEPAAREAIDLFVRSAAREAGALCVALEGLDALVFTAGIGENAPAVRAAICARLAWLGIDIDAASNAAGAPVISTAQSRVKVRVLPTDEERMIALHTVRLLYGDPS